jgi:uncharacterized cofD-like protein
LSIGTLDVSEGARAYTFAVALGGGHGITPALQALVEISDEVTGIVGTIDDGGSSGRLRSFLGILPPGDLRMALAALLPDDEEATLWRAVLQHRFDGQVDVGGHALGNLLMAALWEETGDVVSALDVLAEAMRARGRVLPNSLEAADLVAEFEDVPGAAGETALTMRGQAEISRTRGVITSMHIDPSMPQPCRPAEEAIRQADLIVLGPGSWFTSVLPHLLVPGVQHALADSAATRVLVVNLCAESGETEGYPAHAYVESLVRLFPEFRMDIVLADRRHVDNVALLETASMQLGARVVMDDLACDGLHDPQLLRSALERIAMEDS